MIDAVNAVNAVDVDTLRASPAMESKPGWSGERERLTEQGGGRQRRLEQSRDKLYGRTASQVIRVTGETDG